MYSGSCLCGGIQFRIHGPLAPIQVCHCSQCRKAQGGPFATNMPIERTALEFTSGQHLMKRFASSPGKARVFCSECGSPIFSERDSLPSLVRIRAGLLNEPLPVAPALHAYTGSKANWWTIHDDLPQHVAGYVASPGQ